MEVNDIVKLIVAIGLTASVVGISIQIMRLIGSLADNISDLRKTVQNIGVITAGFVKEQQMLDGILSNVGSIVESVKDMVNNIKDDVIAPAIQALSFVKKISQFVQGFTERFTKKS